MTRLMHMSSSNMIFTFIIFGICGNEQLHYMIIKKGAWLHQMTSEALLLTTKSQHKTSIKQLNVNCSCFVQT